MTADLDRRGGAPDSPEALLRDNLGAIERVVERICHQAGLRDADADDFASVVHLALIENDYAILRAWQQRSSLATYLTVVVRRLLSNERNRTRGRWEPSAEARRSGPAAVLLETLVRRDGQSLDQVLPRVRSIDPSLSRIDLETILARIPERVARPRPLALDDVDLQTIRAASGADTNLHSKELHRLSLEAGRVMRRALASCTIEDRTIVRLHFGSSMSVADIARMLRLSQRPLYRRLEALLQHLRRALVAAGIDAVTAGTLIGSAVQELDFGLEDGKSDGVSQSIPDTDAQTRAER